jgi:hypothetical protein
MSLYHLAYIIASCGFTTEPTRSDYGYDLSVFTFDTNGYYENGNVFVQLKATDTLKIDQKTGAVRFRLSKKDVRTWEREPFPAYLVIFDVKRKRAFSTYLQQHFAKSAISSSMMKNDSVEIRLSDKPVDLATIRGWRIDKNRVLKQMGAVTHV